MPSRRRSGLRRTVPDSTSFEMPQNTDDRSARTETCARVRQRSPNLLSFGDFVVFLLAATVAVASWLIAHAVASVKRGMCARLRFSPWPADSTRVATHPGPGLKVQRQRDEGRRRQHQDDGSDSTDPGHDPGRSRPEPVMREREYAQSDQTAGGVGHDVTEFCSADGRHILGHLEHQACPDDRAEPLPPRPRRREQPRYTPNGTKSTRMMTTSLGALPPVCHQIAVTSGRC